jgi:fumarylacetoacetate (FAA) hydrolase
LKLASLRNGTRDGALAVVNRAGDRFASAADVAPSLQAALDDWERAEPALRAKARALEAGDGAPLRTSDLEAPLPRAYEWIDGSAFLSHVGLVRRARGADVPPSLRTDPLVYQGGSGVLLAPTAKLRAPANLERDLGDVGMDFEGEVCVILGDTPLGTKKEDASRFVRLVLLANDVTYRNLVPAELAKGFGFFVSKPATAFSPFAVTADELGPAWHGGRLHLPLEVWLNGERVGNANAGEMHFSFEDLVAHVTRTRALTAGTILGSGTVSNEDNATGVSCLVERRAMEIISYGSPRAPYLVPGDRIRMEMFAADGTSIFGAIDQEVVSP